MMVDKIDLDKNGTISYMEFMAAACNHKEVACKENLSKAFAFFDKDRSGGIDIEELMFALPSNDDIEGGTVQEKLVNDSVKQFN